MFPFDDLIMENWVIMIGTLSVLFRFVTGRAAVQTEGTFVPGDSRTRRPHKQIYRHLLPSWKQFCKHYSSFEFDPWGAGHYGYCNRIPGTPVLPIIVPRYQSHVTDKPVI